jgi:hypothetical protein
MIGLERRRRVVLVWRRAVGMALLAAPLVLPIVARSSVVGRIPALEPVGIEAGRTAGAAVASIFRGRAEP